MVSRALPVNKRLNFFLHSSGRSGHWHLGIEQKIGLVARMDLCCENVPSLQVPYLVGPRLGSDNFHTCRVVNDCTLMWCLPEVQALLSNALMCAQNLTCSLAIENEHAECALGVHWKAQSGLDCRMPLLYASFWRCLPVLEMESACKSIWFNMDLQKLLNSDIISRQLNKF